MSLRHPSASGPVVPRRRHARVAVAALGATIVLAAAACGGSTGNAAKVATLGSTTANSETASSAPKSTQEALLSYASCMRDNGVAMKDPTFDANGQPTGGLFGRNSGIDRTSATFKTAQTACGSFLKGITLGGGRFGQGGALNRQAVQTGLNDFTACLRDAGLNVNDINFSAGAPGGGNGPGGGGFGGPPGTGGATTGTAPAGGATSGSTPPDGGGFGGPPGTGNPAGGNGGGRGAGFDPSARIIKRLGLDPEDPTVTAAVTKCQPILTAAFQGATGTTTTTAG